MSQLKLHCAATMSSPQSSFVIAAEFPPFQRHASPAPGSACPVHDLAAMSASGALPAGRRSTSAAASAPTSIGSPREVPMGI